MFAAARCHHAPDLTGKVAVITGTTSGIGRETALRLASHGASLVLLDRDPKRAAETAELCRAKGPRCAVENVVCDLSDIASVQTAAREVLAAHPKIDFLFNNAGVMACPLSDTRQGYEMQYGTNHLGHFALTMALLPALIAGKARVICTSSMAHTMAPKCGIDFEHGLKAADVRAAGGFGMTGSWAAYGQSKLANILFAKELQRRYGAQGLTAFSLHPGVISTNLGRHMSLTSIFSFVMKPFSKTPEEGAQTQLYCGLAPLEELVPGAYYSDCAIREPSDLAKDEQLARRLWEVSEAQVAAVAPAQP